jgi:hypothetical protein
MAKAKASGHNLLVDPELKKKFIEARDHWKSLDDRANSAAAKRRQYQGDIKSLGFSMRQIKDSLLLSTPEGEAEFKAEIANRLLAAAYSDADIGEQLTLFLDHNRTPAVDRAFKEGQTSAMKNEAAVPKYDPNTEQYRAFMDGYHEEQARQVKAGIGKLEEGPKGGKKGKKAKAAAPASGKKRGRPPKAAKGPNADAPAGSTRTLISKAEKEAKAAARAPKPDAGPRRPVAAPVTRGSLKAQKEAAREEADSYFTKAEPQGNA